MRIMYFHLAKNMPQTITNTDEMLSDVYNSQEISP